MPRKLITLGFGFWCYVMKRAKFDYLMTSGGVRGFLFAGNNNTIFLISCYSCKKTHRVPLLVGFEYRPPKGPSRSTSISIVYTLNMDFTNTKRVKLIFCLKVLVLLYLRSFQSTMNRDSVMFRSVSRIVV